MGKTRPTTRDLLQMLHDDLDDYRRGLRLDRQDAFDRVWQDIQQQSMALKSQNNPDLSTMALLAACVEQEKKRKQLAARVRELEQEIGDD